MAANNAAIVRARIQLARTLTLAGGVEDESVVDHLCLLHCDEAQGYHFVRPVPADEFLAYLVARLPAGRIE